MLRQIQLNRSTLLLCRACATDDSGRAQTYHVHAVSLSRMRHSRHSDGGHVQPSLTAQVEAQLLVLSIPYTYRVNKYT